MVMGMRMSKVVTTGACHLQLANNHEVGSGTEIGTMGIYRGFNGNHGDIFSRFPGGSS